jgi:ketosteroid isomerase-like protein
MATPAEMVRAHFDARANRDVARAMALFATDVELHLPEVVPFADRPGLERLMAILEYLLHWTDGTYAADLVGVLGDDRVAVALVSVTAARDGVRFAHQQSWTYRFDGGVVVEAWVHLDRSESEIAALYGDPSGADGVPRFD